MDARASPRSISETFGEFTARPRRWWSLPACCAWIALCVDFFARQGETPAWMLEAVVLLGVLPLAVLSLVAIPIDIGNKYESSVPPGFFLYPLAILAAPVLGLWTIYLGVGSYLFFWVWPGKAA